MQESHFNRTIVEFLFTPTHATHSAVVQTAVRVVQARTSAHTTSEAQHPAAQSHQICAAQVASLVAADGHLRPIALLLQDVNDIAIGDVHAVARSPLVGKRAQLCGGGLVTALDSCLDSCPVRDI